MDAQERARLDVIVPSELSPDELWRRNGEYVPLDKLRQAEQTAREEALEEAAGIVESRIDLVPLANLPLSGPEAIINHLRKSTATAIRALKEVV